jgi:hypothetical protein
MSEDAEVDWRAIARERWPLFKIEGNGPFVAIPRGEGTVYLFSTLFARTKGAPPNSQLVTLRPRERAQKTSAG